MKKRKQLFAADFWLSCVPLNLFRPNSLRETIISSPLSLGRWGANPKLTFIVRCFLIFLLAEKARELILFYLAEKLLKLQKIIKI